MFENASPSDVIAFLQRVDSTVLANRSPIEAWQEFLKKNSGTGGTLHERENNWLASKGATSNSGSGHDRADNYMSSKGYTGSKQDKIRSYFKTSAVQ